MTGAQYVRPTTRVQLILSESIIGIALIGAGYWGPNLLRNFQQNGDFDVRYLCDLDEARAKKVLGGYSTIPVSVSVDAVLSDPAVRAVAVATPPDTHLPVVAAALKAGKHVLVEKPLAANLQDGRELVRLAESSGLILMVDHTFCYTPVVRRLRSLVRDGELGDFRYVDSVRVSLGLVRPDVDVLWDLAPHDIAIVDSVCPGYARPVAVAAHGADPLGLGRACMAYLSLRLSNGGMAHAHVSWLSPTKIRTVTVGGAKRTAIWNDLDPQQRLAVHDQGVEIQDAQQQRPLYRTGDTVYHALPEKEALRSVTEEFARAIRSGLPTLTDGRSGLRVLATLEAARQSMQADGAFVPLEFDKQMQAVTP
ncbi:oxidoreductase [Streptomyces lavendulae subsp. lavendulae]|nr:oxidoreductase [Streptomyces lavendulae subsp. lavendulae]